jgi:hypothetical protein
VEHGFGAERAPSPSGDVPGAPESQLAAADVARLPASTPDPPWRCRLEAVIWWHRAEAALVADLPPELGARYGRALVLGALVRYLDTPVGPYEEIIGAVQLRPLTIHIPFIAVDSLASVHGGRAHWALPKALATFSHTDGQLLAAGTGWRVAAQARPAGPMAGWLCGRQLDAAGRLQRSTTTVLGRTRLGRVTVQVDSDQAGKPGSIAGWLRSGRHRGLVLQARARVA